MAMPNYCLESSSSRSCFMSAPRGYQSNLDISFLSTVRKMEKRTRSAPTPECSRCRLGTHEPLLGLPTCQSSLLIRGVQPWCNSCLGTWSEFDGSAPRQVRDGRLTNMSQSLVVRESGIVYRSIENSPASRKSSTISPLPINKSLEANQ